jgi:hypothetical protein
MKKYTVNDPVVVRLTDNTVVLGRVETIKIYNDSSTAKTSFIYHVRAESGRLLPPALIDNKKAGAFIDSSLTEKYYAVKEAPMVQVIETEDESTAIELDSRMAEEEHDPNHDTD